MQPVWSTIDKYTVAEHKLIQWSPNSIPKHITDRNACICSWERITKTFMVVLFRSTNKLKSREMVKYTAVFSHNEIPCSKENEQSNCTQKYRYSQTINVKETI